VTKPFSLPELAARVQACLRRSGGAKNIFTFDEVVIDFDVNEIRHPDRVEKLSKRERDLLEFFLYNRHRILSREELLRKVWGYKAGIATRTVDTHVLTVRKKLGDDAAQPRFVETLHGVGYQFIAKGG
jgi:DNA-binding response OmpR family regulator